MIINYQRQYVISHDCCAFIMYFLGWYTDNNRIFRYIIYYNSSSPNNAPFYSFSFTRNALLLAIAIKKTPNVIKSKRYVIVPGTPKKSLKKAVQAYHIYFKPYKIFCLHIHTACPIQIKHILKIFYFNVFFAILLVLLKQPFTFICPFVFLA